MSSGTLHRFVPVELHSGQQWAFAYTGNLSSCVSIMETTVLLKNRMKAIVCIFFLLLLWGRTCVIYQPPLLVKFPFLTLVTHLLWNGMQPEGEVHSTYIAIEGVETQARQPICEQRQVHLTSGPDCFTFSFCSMLQRFSPLLWPTDVFDCAQITLPEN